MSRIVVTQETIARILAAHKRYEAGIDSPLTAAIEQIEAMFLGNYNPHVAAMIDALKAFNDGDSGPLDDLIARKE